MASQAKFFSVSGVIDILSGFSLPSDLDSYSCSGEFVANFFPLMDKFCSIFGIKHNHYDMNFQIQNQFYDCIIIYLISHLLI